MQFSYFGEKIKLGLQDYNSKYTVPNIKAGHLTKFTQKSLSNSPWDLWWIK